MNDFLSKQPTKKDEQTSCRLMLKDKRIIIVPRIQGPSSYAPTTKARPTVHNVIVDSFSFGPGPWGCITRVTTRL